jgi:uroporphyrinogen-III decarboxylase
MTTGIDRLIAVSTGGKCDRIPVFCNLFDQGANELGLSIEEYYTKGEYVAEAQLKMREKYGYDNVWSHFYVGKEAGCLGKQKMLYVEDGPPNIKEPIIKTYDDIANLHVPDNLEDHPGFAEQRKCLEILNREVGGKYAITVYITSSMTLPIMLLGGMENWLQLLFNGPTDVRDELLDKCFKYFVKEVETYRNLGANALVYSNAFGSTDTVPMNYFMEHSLPLIEKELQAVGPEGLIYYAGMARFNKVIEAVQERAPFGTFYLSPLDDVADGKRRVAGSGITCGVINDCKLVDWTPEEVRANVKEIIDAGMPGGQFAFGASATLFHTPEENIRAMLDAAYEYGSY